MTTPHMPHELVTPSAWVTRWAGLIPQGAVLDLACGSGRHARFLAALGHEVTAVDRDAQALGTLAGVTRVTTLRADLEGGNPWPLPGRRFAGIVVTNYLYRPLFPHILESLAPGGVLIYETFALGNERFGRPANPHFLLRAGELLDAFAAELTVVAFEQGLVSAPGPAVVQRLCGARAPVDAIALDAGAQAIP
jgi:SAM-dependent methyltransferase